MRPDPEKHCRRSIRLAGCDYTQTGAYFVTLVTSAREPYFNALALRRVAETFWRQLPERFPGLELDEWVLMPNHLHGVLVFTSTSAHPLGTVIGQYKSRTTKQINRMLHTEGSDVWQRNYYERIVRSDVELDAIRQYIRDNPAQWELDENYR